MSEVDWSQLIERLKTKEGCSSYSALAQELQVPLSSLSDARSGRRELASEVKADILVRLCDPIDQKTYESLFPERSRAVVKRHLEDTYDPANKKKLPDDFWVWCLDQLQAKVALEGQRKTDVNVAAKLEVTNVEISGIRSGTRTASIPLKIRILDKLGYMSTRDVLLELLPRKAAQKIRMRGNLRFQRKKS